MKDEEIADIIKDAVRHGYLKAMADLESKTCESCEYRSKSGDFCSMWGDGWNFDDYCSRWEKKND